jgi:uncharacterized protein
MDAILELYSEDNPKTFSFVRQSQSEKIASRRLSEWEGRLTGRSRMRMFSGIFESAAFKKLQQKYEENKRLLERSGKDKALGVRSDAKRNSDR